MKWHQESGWGFAIIFWRSWLIVHHAGTPCASSPCQNGGTCLYADNYFVCRCASGSEGTLCDESELYWCHVVCVIQSRLLFFSLALKQTLVLVFFCPCAMTGSKYPCFSFVWFEFVAKGGALFYALKTCKKKTEHIFVGLLNTFCSVWFNMLLTRPLTTSETKISSFVALPDSNRICTLFMLFCLPLFPKERGGKKIVLVFQWSHPAKRATVTRGPASLRRHFGNQRPSVSA